MAIFRAIARNVVINAHNLIVLPIIWIVFDPPLNSAIILFLPGLALTLLNFGWIGLFLGTLCARFRDVPPIVQNITQFLFFVTPIMYKPTQLAPEMRILSHYNPFANWLEILRAPLLGQIPEAHHYVMVGIFTVLGYLIAVPFYARFRSRIVYWL